MTYFFPGDDGKFQAVAGDTFVAVIKFGDPVRAKALLSYGNTTQPGSPHIGDQLELYAHKELRSVWRARDKVEANLKYREVVMKSESIAGRWSEATAGWTTGGG